MEAAIDAAPGTLSTQQVLQPGSMYRVRIHLPPSLGYDDAVQAHPFVWDRVMRYDGLDTAWYGPRSSLVFSDDVQLFEVLDAELAEMKAQGKLANAGYGTAFKAFGAMTHVCGSHLVPVDGASRRWAIHICEHWHTGARLLEVCTDTQFTLHS
jgi:hypothetical protein